MIFDDDSLGLRRKTEIFREYDHDGRSRSTQKRRRWLPAWATWSMGSSM